MIQNNIQTINDEIKACGHARNNFQFDFINSKADETAYTDILIRTFSEEYGYSLHDLEGIYNGFHSTLVCKFKGAIVGGVSAYVVDTKRTDKLPMERRGIDLKKYIDLKDNRYAEICRAGVLKEFRQYNIYPELMKRCVEFCIKIGCTSGFWVARPFHSQYYAEVLSSLGYNVKKLAKINHLHAHGEKTPNKIEYHLSALLID